MTDVLQDARLFDVESVAPLAVPLTLRDRFLVPPFSVLDTRAGYWRDRKQRWLRLGIKGELAPGERELAALERDGLLGSDGRSDRLLNPAGSRKGMGGDYDLSKGENAYGGSGTSLFDPVLCELLYRWFCPQGGQVLDPFAGGSVRGVVAAMMERIYYGIDLREEQVEANRQQADQLHTYYSPTPKPVWAAGDSGQLLLQEQAEFYDFVFSCPPYYDLEVYSDHPCDLSNLSSYEEFQQEHAHIIDLACRALAPDRFAAWVVGEVRDKSGCYLGLVPDTIKAFEAAGLRLYNEAVLLTAVGSLPVRVSAAFGPGRKLGKSHQNVLVFAKGDPRKAADACGLVEEVALEQGGAVWRADGSAVAGSQTFNGAAGGDERT